VPTETVYGLAADASNPDAVAGIFAAKGRPADHPLIVHLPGADDLDDWAADVAPAARALAEACWPGPLTLVLPRTARVPDAVTGGRDTVGLRVPDHPVTGRLLRRFGGGLAAPSANRFGRVSPTRAEHVVADLGDRVDVVLDGGPCRVGVESTIVEVVGGRVALLRTGAITAEQVEAITGEPVVTDVTGPVRAPGMLESHYAPAARVVVAGDDPTAEIRRLLDDGRRVAVLAEAPPPGLPPEAVVLEPVGDADGYARHLYQRLRDADAVGADVVVAVPPAPEGAGVAVRDRLRRAAAAAAAAS
jgi:L-threonylcarbamoyladenylate synthase